MSARPALLLLHGFTGSPASWRRVAAALPLAVRTQALPLPGHDPSMPVVSGGFEANAAALLRAAPAGPLWIAGYSLGARLALGMLSIAPDRIAGMTLAGVHPGLTTGAARAERRAADARWCRVLRTDGPEAFVDLWQDLPLFATQQSLPADRLAAQRAIRLAHDPEALARSLEETGLAEMPDYRDLLRSTSVPITLVTGQLDPKFDGLANEIRRIRAPGTYVVRVDGAGHNVLLEAPEVVAGVISEAYGK